MKKIIFIIVALILLAGGAYWLLSQKKLGSTKYTGPIENVSLKLKWLHQAQFAGNYVAQEKGFYLDEGLKVDIVPFSIGDSDIDSVVNGKVDFGIAGADEIVLARAAEKPVVAVAVIYKINPVTAYTLKSSGIIKPQDFIGKSVGLQRGQNVEYLYSAMMKKLGIDRGRIREVTIGHNTDELLAGKVDVSTGYIINEPHLAMMKGREINTILMADYGVNMYADVLFATENTIKSKPELVERFLRATLKGWQYAIEHDTEAVDITLKYTTEKDKVHQSYMLKASIPLILTGDSKLGWMEPKQWEQVQNILFDQKILSKRIVIVDAYTMQFLQKVYPQ